MPRSRPPRTITLLLPSISASSSASSSSDPPGTSTHPSEHNLEVLLRAQKIASERGQYLDITSFMTPSQRLQYLSSSTRYNKSSSSLPLPLPLSSLSSSALSNPLPTIPPPSASQATKRHPNEKSDPIPSVTDQAQSDSTNTPPPDSPHQPQPKKPRHLPDLSHLHWKQRQKRLAMIATGEISEDSDLFLEKERDSPGPPVASSYLGRSKGEVDKEAVQKSASYWNHLLVQARRSRGPQWDYNTQSYQVDRHSKEYYTHMSKPRSDHEVNANASKIKQEPTEETSAGQGMVNGHDYQTPEPAFSSVAGDSGRATRTPSTGRIESTSSSSAGINGQRSLPGQFRPHLQPTQPQYAALMAPEAHQHAHAQSMSQYRMPNQYQPQNQHSRQLQYDQQYQLQPQSIAQAQIQSRPQSQPQIQPQVQSYHLPSNVRYTPAQLNQLQFAQMRGLDPSMLHMGRVGGGIGGGGVQGQGLGQGNDPASMGNANMSAFTGMPAMANHSGGGGEMTGSNGMQMMSSNMLGQHSYGADPRGPQAQAQGSMPIQGQEPMLSSATGVQGPMIGGGWAGYGS